MIVSILLGHILCGIILNPLCNIILWYSNFCINGFKQDDLCESLIKNSFTFKSYMESLPVALVAGYFIILWAIVWGIMGTFAGFLEKWFEFCDRL